MAGEICVLSEHEVQCVGEYRCGTANQDYHDCEVATGKR